MDSTLTEREAKLLRFCKENPVLANQFEEVMDLMEGCGDELRIAGINNCGGTPPSGRS